MIRELTEEYLEQVVRLHLDVLGHTLNSRIGYSFIRALYRTATRYGHCLVFVRGDEIAGFISYCTDRPTFTRNMFRGLELREYIRAGLYLFCHPTMFSELYRQQAFGILVRDMPGVYITTLGVSPRFQGMGIGAALLEAVLSRTEGPIRVDTEKSNLQARAFYAKHGFHNIFTKYGSVLLCLDRGPR